MRKKAGQRFGENAFFLHTFWIHLPVPQEETVRNRPAKCKKRDHLAGDDFSRRRRRTVSTWGPGSNLHVTHPHDWYSVNLMVNPVVGRMSDGYRRGFLPSQGCSDDRGDLWSKPAASRSRAPPVTGKERDSIAGDKSFVWLIAAKGRK